MYNQVLGDRGCFMQGSIGIPGGTGSWFGWKQYPGHSIILYCIVFITRTEPRDIADEYGVQYITLWWKINRRKTRKKVHRKEQKLTAGEEKMLKDWVCNLDNQGFPPKVEMVSDIACNILLKRYDNAEEVDKKDLIGKHWITHYLNRHPELVKFTTPKSKFKLRQLTLQAHQQLQQDPTHPRMKELINNVSAAEQGHTRGDIHQEGEQKLIKERGCKSKAKEASSAKKSNCYYCC